MVTPAMTANRERLAIYLRAWADDIDDGLPIVHISQYRSFNTCEEVLTYEVRVPDLLTVMSRRKDVYPDDKAGTR